MRCWVLLLGFLAACGFSVAGTQGQPGDASDAGDTGDGSLGGEPGPIRFGSAPIDLVCPPAFGTSPLTWSSSITIDTSTSTMCTVTTANGVPVCVISAESITIADNVTISVRGDRPLVLVATGANGEIRLVGAGSRLDAGSEIGSAPGPAALTGAICTVGATAATSRGGGAGGSAAGKGGNGGADNAASGAGGAGNALGAPTTLHGGCNGSGSVDVPMEAAGGGAVALIARTIQISGTLTASGAGGSGATTNNGGGSGGGAGGMIVLDAATITGVGRVLAQGGGGGEGSGGNNGRDGYDGYDYSAVALSTLGGSAGSPSGGDGGLGASGLLTAGGAGLLAAPGGAAAGGGGGGGGPGFTKLLGGPTFTSVTCSPPPS